MKTADAVDADMGVLSARATKFCFRVQTSWKTARRKIAAIKKVLLVSITFAVYLPRREQEGLTAVEMITARRGVLRTFAFTMATSVIGIASAATPSVAAVGPTLMPPGATNLISKH